MDAIENRIRRIRIEDTLSEDCQKHFQNFLERFKNGEELKYVQEAEKMVSIDQNSLPVSFNDLMEFDNRLSNRVMLLFIRLYPYLCKATTAFINQHISDEDNKGRDYACHFIDFPTLKDMRNLKTSCIGKLVRFRAQVIRSHAVHPELVFGTFKCSDCGTVVKDIEQEFVYTQPTVCANPQCMNRLRFELVVSESKFVDFQKVRVQESQDELPRGCLPRSLDVILRGDTVEKAQPGDLSEFIGTLIVIPDVSQIATPGSRTLEKKPLKANQGYDAGITGIKGLGVRDLTYRMAFLANHVKTVNKFMPVEELRDCAEITFDNLTKKMTVEELNKVLAMKEDPNLIVNLCNSLFPTIYGSDEVKRGLLLMLFGGVPKVTEEGTKLRGDINICIVGDPSTAKSQFLKRISDFVPRAVYTSGKASSAAGLTAAVVRDQESSEFVIEAGALMLANNGICCIDEFDKMDIRDQVAIHEAMEQQTISITKAGIKATLNARTSVLAAANPVGGRYDRSKSLRQNISLSAPIMSRFDLFYVLVDECNEQVDYEIVRRILKCQRKGGNNEMEKAVYSEDDIRLYIAFCRCFDPKITEGAYEKLSEEYRKMRQRDAASGNQSAWKITVRQLESLIRLSEATAKMRLSDYVEDVDVIEANRLLNRSIIRVEQPDINLSETYTPRNKVVGQDEENDVDMDIGERQILSYEDYNKITDVVLSYLKAVEMDDKGLQIKRSELVEWYLESIVETITDETVLVQKKQMIEMVIKRLIEKDNLLIAIHRTAFGDTADNLEQDPIILLHPNVPLE